MPLVSREMFSECPNLGNYYFSRHGELRIFLANATNVDRFHLFVFPNANIFLCVLDNKHGNLRQSIFLALFWIPEEVPHVFFQLVLLLVLTVKADGPVNYS